ncbi:MAG: response regulator transcription factor [Pyrinomonadaceae bacterium]
MSRLLVVDDDVELCGLLEEYLRAEAFTLECVHDGGTGTTRALSGEHDLVILDVMLPVLNGFEVLRRIRAGSNIPVLMLTARGDEVDRIAGFAAGADDYLPKPFNPRELVARVRAILRRQLAHDSVIPSGDILTEDDIAIDVSGRSARLSGHDLALTAVEFDLLVELVRAAGTVISREQLTRKVLDRELSPFDRSIDMHVSHLRRKLGPRAEGSERIRTIRAAGYVYTRASRLAGPTD